MKLFMKDHFEIHWYASTSLDINESTIGRMKNQFVKAITEQVLFLKLVLVIPDANIAQSVKYNDYGVSEIYR